MANEEHLARLKQGVEAWNQWRGERRNIYRRSLDGGPMKVFVILNVLTRIR